MFAKLVKMSVWQLANFSLFGEFSPNAVQQSLMKWTSLPFAPKERLLRRITLLALNVLPGSKQAPKSCTYLNKLV